MWIIFQDDAEAIKISFFFVWLFGRFSSSFAVCCLRRLLSRSEARDRDPRRERASQPNRHDAPSNLVGTQSEPLDFRR